MSAATGCCSVEMRHDPDANLLPLEAWEVAGENGAERGLNAVLPGHVRGYHEVVSEHDGWLAVRDTRTVSL